VEIENRVLKLSIDNKNLYGTQIELTTNCNWRCRHCYLPAYNNYGMTRETISEIFSQLREMGTFEITLTGGEIFTRPDALSIISEARKLGFSVILLTNISLLNEDIIQKLQELYISKISCTVFSLNEETHDFIVQRKGALKKVLVNLELLKKYNIPVEVKTIIMNVNLNDWKELEQFCEKNKFGYRIDHDIFIKSDGDITPVDLRITKSQFEMECLNLDRMRGFNVAQHNPDEYVCDQIRNFLFIDCNGNVYPCEKFLYKLGNINEENIVEIWKKSKELKRLQEMRWRDLKKCVHCNISSFCMRCPGTAFLENGSEYEVSSMACEKAEIRASVYKERVN
jgi:radical SAM protein with 4Fe4S-binding SPASM domain